MEVARAKAREQLTVKQREVEVLRDRLAEQQAHLMQLRADKAQRHGSDEPPPSRAQQRAAATEAAEVKGLSAEDAWQLRRERALRDATQPQGRLPIPRPPIPRLLRPDFLLRACLYLGLYLIAANGPAALAGLRSLHALLRRSSVFVAVSDRGLAHMKRRLPRTLSLLFAAADATISAAPPLAALVDDLTAALAMVTKVVLLFCARLVAQVVNGHTRPVAKPSRRPPSWESFAAFLDEQTDEREPPVRRPTARPPEVKAEQVAAEQERRAATEEAERAAAERASLYRDFATRGDGDAPLDAPMGSADDEVERILRLEARGRPWEEARHPATLPPGKQRGRCSDCRADHARSCGYHRVRLFGTQIDHFTSTARSFTQTSCSETRAPMRLSRLSTEPETQLVGGETIVTKRN